MNKLKRFSLSSGLALVALLCTGALGHARVVGTFDRTLTVNGPVDLEVFTHSGDITVRSGPAGAVTIHGIIHAEAFWFSTNRDSDVQALQKDPPIHQTGNSVRIDYVNLHNIAVDYEITVPTETSLRSHTGSGDQNVDGLKGRIELEAGSGDLRLTRVTGEMRFRTGSGNVTGRELAGPLQATAGSGDLEIEETGVGDVEIHTGSGNIQLRGVKGGLRAEAGSGDITADGQLKGGWQIRTGSGDVQMKVPSDTGFDVDISTSSGEVSVDRPVTMVVQGRVMDGHKEVKGKVGSGGPLLSVHTGSGDVSLR
jgi:hypothetical protein